MQGMEMLVWNTKSTDLRSPLPDDVYIYMLHWKCQAPHSSVQSANTMTMQVFVLLLVTRLAKSLTVLHLQYRRAFTVESWHPTVLTPTHDARHSPVRIASNTVEALLTEARTAFLLLAFAEQCSLRMRGEDVHFFANWVAEAAPH